jgi:Ras of Complex, Roc, domain of DAPkinase
MLIIALPLKFDTQTLFFDVSYEINSYPYIKVIISIFDSVIPLRFEVWLFVDLWLLARLNWLLLRSIVIRQFYWVGFLIFLSSLLLHILNLIMNSLSYTMKNNVAKFKLVFLGDQGVGKTSIINRFIYDTFQGTH